MVKKLLWVFVILLPFSYSQTCADLGKTIGGPPFEAVEIGGICRVCNVTDGVCPEYFNGIGYGNCSTPDEDCTNINLNLSYQPPGCPLCNPGYNSSTGSYLAYSVFDLPCTGDCISRPNDLICGDNASEYAFEELDSEGDSYWVDNILDNILRLPFKEDCYGLQPMGTENVIDDSPGAACCAKSTDCNDDGYCYLSVERSCGNTSGQYGILGCTNTEEGEASDLTGDSEICNSSRWHDPDESNVWCNMSSDETVVKIWYNVPHPRAIDDYDNNPGNGYCAGDDLDESLIWEHHSPLRDNIDSASMCPMESNCIDDMRCYNSTNDTSILAIIEPRTFTRNLGEPGDTGDSEICNSTDNMPWSGRNDWHDADEPHFLPSLYPGPYCNLEFTISNLTGDSLENACEGDTCWIQEGEEQNFGGFNLGSTTRQEGCCGDDSMEFFIHSNETERSTCCNATDRCVYHESGICGSCDAINGSIWLEDINNPGTFVQAADTLQRVNVMVFNRSNLELLTNTTNMSVNGTKSFFLRAPSDSKFLLTFEVKSDRYVPLQQQITLNPGLNNFGDIYLRLSKTCQADCTMNDLRCHSECEGIGGCSYPNFMATSGQYKGMTPDEICNGQGIGWEISLNDTHYFNCCDRNPISRTTNPVVIKQEDDVENIKTFEHLLTYKGKKLKMFVSVWERKE